MVAAQWGAYLEFRPSVVTTIPTDRPSRPLLFLPYRTLLTLPFDSLPAFHFPGSSSLWFSLVLPLCALCVSVFQKSALSGYFKNPLCLSASIGILRTGQGRFTPIRATVEGLSRVLRPLRWRMIRLTQQENRPASTDDRPMIPATQTDRSPQQRLLSG